MREQVAGTGQFMSAKPCRIIKDGPKGFRVVTQCWERSGFKSRDEAQAVFDDYMEIWRLGNRFIFGK